MQKLVTRPSKNLTAEGGRFLHDLIDASIEKDRDYFRLINLMRDFLDGSQWKHIPKKKKEEMRMVVNLAHAHVRSLVPTLFFKNPSVDCLPTAPQHSGKEQVWNGLLNNTLDKIGFAQEMKKVALDAACLPEACVKDLVSKPVDEGSKNQTESGVTGTAVWLNKGAPVHVRLNPSQLIVDYLSKGRELSTARFIAIRYKKTAAELKFHPIYKKNFKETGKSRPMPTTGNAVGNSNTRELFDDWEASDDRAVSAIANEQIYTIYEVWIHQLISEDGQIQIYQQMCVLLQDQMEPLRDLTPWSEVMVEGYDKYPVERIVLNPIPDRNSLSELEVWKDLQTAINWAVSRITQLVENDKLLYACQPDKIKNFEKFKKAFKSGSPREIVEVTENGAVELLQPSFVGRDNYTLVNLLQQLSQQVTGIGQNRRGGAGIRTAREAHIIEAGTQLKTDEKVDQFEKLLINVVTKTALLCRGLAKQDFGIEWVYRIGGDVGAVDWIKFTADDISWIPEIRFRVNSFRKQDSLEDMQRYGAVIQIASQLRTMYGPQVRVDLLFVRLLQSIGIYDAEKIVGTQDAETMKQLVEISLMVAGQEVPVDPNENHAAHHAVIESLRVTQMGAKLLQSPVVADLIERHDQMHMQYLLEQEQKMKQNQVMGTNPFAMAGGDNQNAVDQAAGVPQDTMPFQETGA